MEKIKTYLFCSRGKQLKMLADTLNKKGKVVLDVKAYNDISSLNGEAKSVRQSEQPVVAVLGLKGKGKSKDDTTCALWRCQYHLSKKTKVIIQLKPYNPEIALMLLRLGAFDVFSATCELWPIVKRAINL
jgi:hypothetical protein